jgi:hypothetical protein
MLTLMMEGVEDVFLSIFVRAVKHTKSEQSFPREISIPSPQIHRECFKACLHVFCSLLISSEEYSLVY